MAAESGVIAEPIVELKFGQVGIANLKLKRLDPAALAEELAQKVASSALFARAPVVLDLSHLPSLPDRSVVLDLFARIRASGMLPVGLAYGTSENDELARSLDLPVFAKFRQAFERANGDPLVPARETRATSAPARETPAPAAAKEPAPKAVASADSAPTVGAMRHAKPVRSGQQVYARGRDLVLAAMVGNGAEVIADGSIHIYGALRGRALAGAQGDTAARIYCSEFHAELVSIAGQYRVFEDIPAELRGKSIQAWLDGDKLVIARLGDEKK